MDENSPRIKARRSRISQRASIERRKKGQFDDVSSYLGIANEAATFSLKMGFALGFLIVAFYSAIEGITLPLLVEGRTIGVLASVLVFSFYLGALFLLSYLVVYPFFVFGISFGKLYAFGKNLYVRIFARGAKREVKAPVLPEAWWAFFASGVAALILFSAGLFSAGVEGWMLLLTMSACGAWLFCMIHYLKSPPLLLRLFIAILPLLVIVFGPGALFEPLSKASMRQLGMRSGSNDVLIAHFEDVERLKTSALWAGIEIETCDYDDQSSVLLNIQIVWWYSTGASAVRVYGEGNAQGFVTMVPVETFKLMTGEPSKDTPMRECPKLPIPKE